jgi:hypothetical protein
MVSSPAVPASAGNGAAAPNHKGTEIHKGIENLDLDSSDNGPYRRVDGQPMHFQLIRPLGKTTWIGTVDGAEVAARPLPCAVEEAETAEIPRVLTDMAEQLIGFLGVGMVDRAPWMLSRYVPGTNLGRLLTAAVLTPFQAATIAIDVFAGVAALHRAGLVHGRLTTGTVRVGDDGISRLSDWAVGALIPTGSAAVDIDPGPAARDRDLVAASAIVDELARNADRPVSRRQDVDGALLACLARIGASGVVDAAEALTILRRALGRAADTGPSRGNAHTELAALVHAAAPQLSVATSNSLVAPRRGTNIWPAGVALSGVNWQARRRRRWVWASAALVAVVIAGVAITVQPGRSTIDRLLHRHHGAGATQTAATAKSTAVPHGGKPHPVPAVAPAATGIVSHVSARPVGTCAPGHACRLAVGFRVTPSAAAQPIGWEVRIYDRCTGTFTSRPGTTLVAPAGATSMRATPTVSVPAGRALALVVTTTRPARAAAAPVLVPATTRAC